MNIRERRIQEHESYTGADSGCHVHPLCLTCPLPQCIYDAPEERLWAARHRHRQRALALRRQGYTMPRIAAALGLSERTVYRILSTAA